MLLFDEEYVRRLNARYGGGRFLKAVILTETTSPLVKRYFVDNDTEISFGGNTYTPIHMRWDGLKVGGGMSLDGMSITVSNLGNMAAGYAYRLDISGNPIAIEILHADLLTTLTSYKKMNFNVLAVRSNDRDCTFTVGRRWGLQDRCGVMLRSEYPGLQADIARIIR